MLTITPDGTIHTGTVTVEDKLRVLKQLIERRKVLSDQIDILVTELTSPQAVDQVLRAKEGV